MSINSVQLKYYSTMPHLSMIIAGFQILHKKGFIKSLSLIDATSEGHVLTNPMVVEAVIDSNLHIAYDVCDGYINYKEVSETLASSVDYYFMRSFSEELNQKHFPNSNVFPLGMNYYCTTKGNLFLKPTTVKDTIKDAAKTILSKFNPQISVAFNVEKFELAPSYRSDAPPKIMFNTRLWDPQGDVGEVRWERMHPERIHINNTRIQVIQQARKLYGDYFTGGLYDTKYAQKTAPPELLLPNSRTTKKQYLKAMQACDICIGSEGLHGSTGWKTAEYVASAKAIIMERPKYTAPEFEEGKNYLGFSTAEECMQQLEFLSNNRNKIVEMQKNNYEYYNKWLRPDMQILRTLEIALQSQKA